MPKKIIDMAKEMGVGPYELVEQLKQKGFDVRNPMSELTDAEVAQVMGGSTGSPGNTGADDASAKKVVKRKVVKKTNSVDDAPAVDASAEKKSTVKRKKVILRKSGDESVDGNEYASEVEGETSELVDVQAPEVLVESASEESETEVVQVEQSIEAATSDGPPADEMKPQFGLRVVSKPKPAAPKVESPAQTSNAPAKGQEENAGPKVHRFTPVYIPPKPVTEVAAGPVDPDMVIVDEDDDSDDKKKGDGKKKIGGLAIMMSGKKVVNRATHIQQSRADDELKSYSALSSLGRPIYTQLKKKKNYAGPSMSTIITEMKDSKKVVEIHGAVTLEELSKKLKVKFKELKDQVLDINLLVKSDDWVGVDLAGQIAALYGYKVEDVTFNEEEVLGIVALSTEDKEKLPLRNPIITIMGHVDHGKTTLLDYIRKEKVAAGEAGGITQHIGAYSVKVSDKTLTFLDTPGHAAFAAMRQRGADVTDIVVLVVAADDGVMPQTRESIKFCEQAGKKLIVAVNKMDKEGVNPDRIKSELAELNITPEEWGGDTQFVHISALKGDGIDELLEAIAVLSEVMELRADPKGMAQGVVIESKIEQGRGPVATVLVQSGTLNKGDSIVVGETYGRARSLMNDRGEQLKSAGPSMPVQIIGLNEAPSPGDQLYSAVNEREAKRIATNRLNERKELDATPVKKKLSLEDFFANSAEVGKEKKTLNLIIRTDVQGSFEAVRQSLEVLGNNEVSVKVIGGGVGAISESDVMLAANSGGFIIGFNMRPITTARRLAEEKGLDIKTYSIIYELINDVKLALEGLLDPETVEEFIGRAEVRETFAIPKIGTIAGSLVIDGKIKDGCNIRLLRQGKIVFDGKMSSLKRFKDEVKEVKNGYECGIGLENFNDVKVDDIFEAYMMVEKKRTLDQPAATN